MPTAILFWILLGFDDVSRIVQGVTESVWCGYPGSPAHGRPHPIRDQYAPGEAVHFICNQPTQLQGPAQRVCTPQGIWYPSVLPICDHPLPSHEISASSRQTLRLYPANRTSDGDPRTCAYTDKMRPRWLRLDMRQPRPLRAVALTVPSGAYAQEPAQLSIYAISVRDATTATYHKCASFNGKFAASSVRLSCAGDVEGRYVHVEDNRHRVDYFSLCEVQIFVHKDSYECGEMERPTHSVTSRSPEGVTYRCVYGYRLVGPSHRKCVSSTGQWVPAEQPRCVEINCPGVSMIDHGRLIYSGGRSDSPTLGTMVNASCDYGFRTVGNPIVCQEDGMWSTGNISCQPIDCGKPVFDWDGPGGVTLLNGTRYGSSALLHCGEHQDYIVCREDGTWSRADTLLEQCDPKQNSISRLGLVEDDPDEIPTGVVIAMAVIVFVLVLLVVLVLLLKRRKVLRQNSLDSLPPKAEAANESAPAANEGETFYATIAHSPKSKRNFFRTVLFPQRRKAAAQSAETKDKESTDTSTTNGCVYEEIGGTKSQSDKRSDSCLPKGDSQGKSREETPVYAQVDLDEKRRTRLIKSRACDHIDPASPPTTETTYRSEIAPSFDEEVDLEPIKLRELPPIPDKGGAEGTYATLATPSTLVMKNNEIYEKSYIPPVQSHSPISVMKDNELYSASSTTLKI